MMYNYPFFSFPHFRRHTSYYPSQSSYVGQPVDFQHQNFESNMDNYINTPSISKLNAKKLMSSTYKANTLNPLEYSKDKSYHNSKDIRSSCTPKKEEVSYKKTPSGFSFLNNIFNQNGRGEDENYFELLGLKLYYDDLLLIGLIFFLYKEDVKDQYLFFALILLLLS